MLKNLATTFFLVSLISYCRAAEKCFKCTNCSNTSFKETKMDCSTEMSVLGKYSDEPEYSCQVRNVFIHI